MSTVPEKAKVQLDSLLDAFRTGSVEATIAKAMIPRHPDDPPRPMDAWSLSNRVLCLLSGTADARGYRQWKESGRQVRKGEKAFNILEPCRAKRKGIDAETGEETERMITFGFRG